MKKKPGTVLTPNKERAWLKMETAFGSIVGNSNQKAVNVKSFRPAPPLLGTTYSELE